MILLLLSLVIKKLLLDKPVTLFAFINTNVFLLQWNVSLGHL